MMIEVRDVVRTLGATRALDGVTFSIRRGEILGLIGPNGAGKTTLLETIAGFVPGGSGDVLVDGRAVPFHRRAQHVFYVPDAAEPWADDAAGDVITFFARAHGGDEGAVVDALALTPVLRSKMSALSKGYRRRVLVALGLLAPQPMVMLDEPFDGLDLVQTRELMKVLRHFITSQPQRERALLLSIHQLADAERICDRFVLLSGGTVRGEGTLAELRTRTASAGLEEMFLALS